jgi:hypothetical protein
MERPLLFPEVNAATAEQSKEVNLERQRGGQFNKESWLKVSLILARTAFLM